MERFDWAVALMVQMLSRTDMPIKACKSAFPRKAVAELGLDLYDAKRAFDLAHSQWANHIQRAAFVNALVGGSR